MKINTKGQTALVLILLTAAALIFLAITMNWGRIAQTKAQLTVAADQAATLLGSEAASYGEMQKQQNLSDQNHLDGSNGGFLAILEFVVIVIAAAFTQQWWLVATVFVLGAANVALQVAVIQPEMTALWNKLQQDQPMTQQFFEQGISTALNGVVSDQVNVTDYFDSNANGAYGFGSNGSTAKDTVGRFALFYTDRLKMLNQPIIPQVALFYNQLGELVNGETCAQNASDVGQYGSSVVPPNSACSSLNCSGNSSDPACQTKIPNSFLNDACPADSNTNDAGYNPYCDPCCQPLTKPDPLHPSATLPMRPSNCDQSTVPAECYKNNPYNSSVGSNDSPYPLLYDPTYQNYADGTSFLDQLGRDEQRNPSGIGQPFLTSLIPQGSAVNGTFFPNGIYPFFWLTKDYSPEVDNIDPTLTSPLAPSQVHWCTTTAPTGRAFAAPAGYADLAQLSLPYVCSGQDCCVNYLPESVTGVNPTPPSTNTPNWTIDVVGNSSLNTTPYSKNPGLDPSFAESSSGTWSEGDAEMCTSTLPYNGATNAYPDGTCEWTGSSTAPSSSPPSVGPASSVDSLDDTLHTLSDFVIFSNNFLSHDAMTLSSSFATWYNQVAQWIAPACGNGQNTTTCNQGSNGRLLSIPNTLNTWNNNVITPWLKNTYTSSTAWCLPPAGTGSATEDAYINSSSGTAAWGDLPHVIACENYNASVAVNNYQACKSALPATGPSVANFPPACAAATLGRSLAGPNPGFGGCSVSKGITKCTLAQANSYSKYVTWVNSSAILATDEAPKFSLRAQFLSNIYNQAKTMQTIFSQEATAIGNFLKPCGSAAACADGGPAAQLMYARTQPDPTTALPNSVIYGWQDNVSATGIGGCVDSNGHQRGCGHIVKVTATSPGRNGNANGDTGDFLSVLPSVQASTSGFLGTTTDYDLINRDGYVYVSVRRWDEPHSSIVNFPNGHLLWQYLFGNPAIKTTLPTGATATGWPPSGCIGLNGGTIGLGLESQTVAGLTYLNYSKSTQDVKALGSAFMLNDNGNGKAAVDPNATGGSSYNACLSAVQPLLNSAPESHVCAKYVASVNASHDPSGGGDGDYSLKFVSCPAIPAEDLTGSNG